MLLGHGEMSFHPSPETEKGQVRIFCRHRYPRIAIRHGVRAPRAPRNARRPVGVEGTPGRSARSQARRAGVSRGLAEIVSPSISRISRRDTWSILPGDDDFLAEIRTRSYDTLTYARSAGEAEDISFFERRRHRNIAVYASKGKLQSRGPLLQRRRSGAVRCARLRHRRHVHARRQWIEGRAVMRLRVRAPSLGQLTIRLADSLVVRSVRQRSVRPAVQPARDESEH